MSIRVDRSNIFTSMWTHAQLGLMAKVGQYEENWVEWTGNKMLWTVEHLPRHIWNALTEPRIVTVAFASIALVADSFLFYPTQTWQHLKTAIRWLPLPSLSTLRLGCYLFTVFLIIGAALRALGRFSNTELMTSFNNVQNRH